MKRILVIEDEPFMLRNLLAALKSKDFDVSGAEDGCRGLELARSQVPDLILCDITMPGKNGYEVLRELRMDPRTSVIPFIFLTGKGDTSDFRAGMNLGADDYLVKPFGTEDLLASIRARLHRQQPGEPPSTARSAGAQIPLDLSASEPLQTLGLTRREAEILLWVANGKTNPEIAVILGISHGTVKKHLEHVFAKLGVETRTAATRTALETLAQRSIRP